MDIRRLVGLNVARLRKERELKQEPLAEVAGFTQSYLSQIENGRVNLTLLRLNDLAECFQVSPKEFFREPN
ncbi:helix-turn-helix domain-containing protein [Sphingomonas sp. NFR15]|uniref:helix-turn-helix domain-containing protein n=1 Tax=Sphingomonas sp. NFR15 TaxID=1566282 RepID=UPI000B88F812|nr:helix-turn-helix transcriptional regulator [Sphingomonas sp. NFR15]